jgi:predicted phosphodiesterase
MGYGPDASAVIERVGGRGIPCVRGNYDDGIGNRRGDCGCHYATEQARVEGGRSYAFTDAALDEGEHARLAALPDELRLDVDGLRVLLVHGSPRKVNEYLLPDRSDEQLARLADGAGADVVCCGHVHMPYHRVVRGADSRPVHYVNSGSVGKPKDGDPAAAWVEVLIGSPDEIAAATPHDAAAGPTAVPALELAAVPHRVTYDVDAVAVRLLAAGLPAAFADALRTGR